MERNLLELVQAPGMSYGIRFAEMPLMQINGAGLCPRRVMMRGLIVPLVRLALLFYATAFCARAEMLFERGAEWQWRAGTSEASMPVTAWREVGFNDAEFTLAPAPFWYGDVYPGGTQISGMQNVYGSMFLRKTFVITNVSEIASLQF